MILFIECKSRFQQQQQQLNPTTTTETKYRPVIDRADIPIYLNYPPNQYNSKTFATINFLQNLYSLESTENSNHNYISTLWTIFGVTLGFQLNCFESLSLSLVECICIYNQLTSVYIGLDWIRLKAISCCYTFATVLKSKTI